MIALYVFLATCFAGVSLCVSVVNATNTVRTQLLMVHGKWQPCLITANSSLVYAHTSIHRGWNLVNNRGPTLL